MTKKLRLRKLIALSFALACAGIWGLYTFQRMQGKLEVEKMMGKKKTVCVGRYLIDVPAEAETSFSGGMLAGFEINTVEESKAAFAKRVAARKAEIESGAAIAGPRGPGGLIEIRDLNSAKMIGEAFSYGLTRIHGIENGRSVDVLSLSVEGYAHLGGVSFSLKKEIADENDNKLAEILLTHLHLRGENEVPAISGFCVPGAVFVEPLPKHINEHMVMYLGVPDHPDLSMMLMVIAGGNPEKSLLTRIKQVDADASFDEWFRVSKLRARKRHVNDLDGEELVERVWEHNFTTGYSFNWETQGTTDSVLRPYMSLEMQTGVSEYPDGKPVGTSFHENALLMLWDDIASSIRLSNGNVVRDGGMNAVDVEVTEARVQAFRSSSPRSLADEHLVVEKAQNRP